MYKNGLSGWFVRLSLGGGFVLVLAILLQNTSLGTCTPGDWYIDHMCYSPTTELDSGGVSGSSGCGVVNGSCQYVPGSQGYCSGGVWEEPQAGRCRDKDPNGNDVSSICREDAATGMVEIEKFVLGCRVKDGSCGCGIQQTSPPTTADASVCVCEDR